MTSKQGLDRFLKYCKGVIHIGASVGQERKIYAALDIPVIWIEPIPEIFEHLKYNIRHLPKQRAFKYLITDTDDQEYEFHIINKRGESSSIFKPKMLSEIFPKIKETDIIKLKSTTLSSFFKKENIDTTQYDALVMDVQGSELLVLKGVDLSSFKYIKTETFNFELYEGCCLKEELDLFIKQQGFKKVASRVQISAVNGRRVLGWKRGKNCYDIVYKRKHENI